MYSLYSLIQNAGDADHKLSMGCVQCTTRGKSATEWHSGHVYMCRQTCTLCLEVLSQWLPSPWLQRLCVLLHPHQPAPSHQGFLQELDGIPCSIVLPPLLHPIQRVNHCNRGSQTSENSKSMGCIEQVHTPTVVEYSAKSDNTLMRTWGMWLA